MAQNQNVNIKATVSVDDSSVKQYNNTLEQTEQKTEAAFNPKKALKEAKLALIEAQQAFGTYSAEAVKAAKRVAELQDQIQDANETAALFDPGKKFQAYSNALQSAAGAFAGVQGAIGLLGVESEKVNEQLLKVQSALALSEGLSTIGDIGKNFGQLATVIKSQVVGAFQALKAAIGSTGIGLLVIALGAIAANWDKIKATVSGVSKEQEALNAKTKANVDAQKKKLESIGSQENVLKLQGKSEKEILELKLAQTKQIIVATKEQIRQSVITTQAQVAAAQRNKDILKGILDFLVKPTQLVIDLFSKVAKLAGVDFQFNIADKISSFVFDPGQVQAEGEAAIAEQKKQLAELENNAAGLQLQLKDIGKKGSDARSADAKKAAEAEAAAQADLAKKRQERELANIKDEDERRKKQIENELAAEKDRINKLEKVKAETKAALIAEAEAKAQIEKDKLDEIRREKEKKNEEDFQKQLNAIKEENDLKAIKNEDERAIQAIKNSYQKQLAEIDANEKFNAEQKALLKAELLEKEDAELSAKQDEIDKKNIEKLKAFEEEKRKIEADTLAATRELQDKRNDLLKAGLNVLSSIAGDNEKIANVIFAIQKAIEIGRIISSTSAAIAQVQAGVAAVPAILPPGIPNPAFAAATAIGIKKTLGLKLSAAAQIAEIAAASISKFKGGGGTAPSGGGAQAISGGGSVAPLQPQIPQAIQNQQLQTSVNQLATQTARAYVVESDVSNSQERIRRINRAATFG